MKFEFPSVNYFFLVNFGVFLFGCLMLAIPGGYSYGPIFLLIIAVPLLFQKKTYQLVKPELIIIAAFLFYPLVNAISLFLDVEMKARDFDLTSRTIIAIIIFLLLLRYRPSFKVIGYAFAVGAWITGLSASYEHFIMGESRALSNITLVIQAGDISMAMGLICLSYALYFYRQLQRLPLFFFTLSAVMGCLGSLFSGSRGGWVMMPVILFVFYRMYKHYLSKQFKITAFACVLGVLVMASIPQLGVIDRVAAAKDDIHLYITGQEKDTSLGIRFQLWQSAWHSFLDKPILGWGYYGIHQSKQAQFESGRISQFIYNFNSHAHNEYLNEMALRGCLGLFSLLLIFGIPLRYFRRFFKESNNIETQTIATAGIMVVLSTMDFCLSQVFLKHNSGVMFYFPAVALFLAFCFDSAQQTK